MTFVLNFGRRYRKKPNPPPCLFSNRISGIGCVSANTGWSFCQLLTTSYSILVFVPTGTFRQLMISICFGYFFFFFFFFNRRKDYKTCSKNPPCQDFLVRSPAFVFTQLHSHLSEPCTISVNKGFKNILSHISAYFPVGSCTRWPLKNWKYVPRYEGVHTEDMNQLLNMVN